MEDQNQQKELFEFEKPKRPFAKLANIFPKPDFEGSRSITLTLEKIVLIAIAVIMLMVAIYAVGVEKGRSVSRPSLSVAVTAEKTRPARQGAAMQSLPPAVSIARPGPLLNPKNTAMLETTAIKIKTIPIEKVEPARPAGTQAKFTGRTFTIIAAAMSNKNTAVRETNRLRSDGFDAAMVQDGRYFKICIGSFPSVESAKSALNRIRQKYKDAYVKQR